MPPAESAKRKRESVGQTIVTLKAGPEGVPFDVHGELLCSSSEYFRGAFKGGFKEAEERSISLSDVPVPLMRQFIQWLYNGVIFPSTDGIMTSFEKRPLADIDLLDEHELLDLYVFGDAHDIPTLQQDTLSMIQRITILRLASKKENISIQFVLDAYEKLPETSPLCEWLVNHFGCTWDTRKLRPGTNDYAHLLRLPCKFFIGVALVSRRRLSESEEQKEPLDYFMPEFHCILGWNRYSPRRNIQIKSPAPIGPKYLYSCSLHERSEYPPCPALSLYEDESFREKFRKIGSPATDTKQLPSSFPSCDLSVSSSPMPPS
ncbi:uncharacterized protein BDZ99DRAFT_467548 [Mytilinidion resinicola]|uniref:BTB domain-containing protein n=1 Tax=Mytilinidion resinicola TaxID=574789 RepID=A0A6A6Y5U0_9PEZI|nr:uncharacterized protein BDZ99DRAFT_467548 [Mytilinidion resinicola]KAF2804176.1 hypothetical protein BDZ99DRAFT_467548 [Mytilinidion resinicola]